MHPSAAHALEAFIARSREAEEAVWARRLKVLGVILGGEPRDLDEFSPPVTEAELLEVAGLHLHARAGTGPFA